MNKEEPVCKKCGLAKKSTSKGTMTEWISVCQCDIQFQSSNDLSKFLICRLCGKRVVEGPDGSLTQWILKQDKCNCEVSEPFETQIKTDVEIEHKSPRSEEKNSDTEPELELDSQSFPVERFKPISKIGFGSAGDVYLSRDRLLGKKVAVKCLKDITTQQIVSFQREAKILSQLDHPNIVKVMDFGTTSGEVPYMVLEYVRGKSVQQLKNQYRTFPLPVAVEIFKKAAEALSHAHSRKIFHRDLRLSNIMVVGDLKNEFQVKLIDFGIGAILDVEPDSKQVQGQSIVGTPAYMSPDQMTGHVYDQRSEIYSLGCVAFELFSGHPPYVGGTALEVMSMHAHHPIPTLKEKSGGRSFPKGVELILSKCMSKKPDERYQSMEELLVELNSISLTDGLTDDDNERSLDVEYSSRRSKLKIVLPILLFAGVFSSVAVIGVGYFLNKVKLESSEKEIAQNRKKANKLTEKVRSLLEGRNAQEALKLADSAYKLDPDNLEILDLRGVANLLTGKEKEAEADFSLAIKRSKELNWNPSAAYCHKGFLYTIRKQSDLAKENIQLARRDEAFKLGKIEKNNFLLWMKYWRPMPPRVTLRRGKGVVENGTDYHLAKLARYKKLSYLVLKDTKFSARGFEKFKGLPIKYLYIESCSFDKGALSIVHSLKSLRSITIISTKDFYGEEAKCISDLSELNRLTISCCRKFTGKEFRFFRNLPKLATIHINQCERFSGDGMKYLSDSPVKRVTVSGINFSDIGLSQILEFRNLNSLSIQDAGNLTGEGLARDVNSNLESLFISGCNITRENWQHLSRFRKLKYFYLMDSKSFMAEALAENSNIEYVNFVGCKFGDEIFYALQNMANLKHVTILDCPVSGSNIGVLSKTPIRKIVFSRLNLKPEAFEQLSKVKSLTDVEFFEGFIEGSLGRMFENVNRAYSSDFFQLAENYGGSGWKFPVDAFDHLSKLPHLEKLNVDCDSLFSGAKFDKLSGLKELRLRGTKQLSDQSVRSISRLPLHSLTVYDYLISDNQLALLSDCKTLKNLDLNYDLHDKKGGTNDSIESLSKLKLKKLSISGGSITISSVKFFARMTSLERLNISNCRFLTRDFLDALRKVLPNCKVHSSYFDRSPRTETLAY